MEDAGEIIIEYITKRRFKRGARLPSIRVLSEQLKVRPSAVRDGLLCAQSIGLVKIHPRSGTVVQSLDDYFGDAFKETITTALLQEETNLLSLIEARVLVECELAGRAAVQRSEQDMISLYHALNVMEECREDRDGYVAADEEFHLAIARIPGNQILVVIVQALLTVLRPYRKGIDCDIKERAHTGRTHGEIYQSIIRGDAETGRAQMKEHIMCNRQTLIDRVTAVLESSSLESSIIMVR